MVRMAAEDIDASNGQAATASSAHAHGVAESPRDSQAELVRIAAAAIAARAGRSLTSSRENAQAVRTIAHDGASDILLIACAAIECIAGPSAMERHDNAHGVVAICCASQDFAEMRLSEDEASAAISGRSVNTQGENDHGRTPR